MHSAERESKIRWSFISRVCVADFVGANAMATISCVLPRVIIDTMLNLDAADPELTVATSVQNKRFVIPR